MTTRTFKQQAAAYGASSASITASINGTQVFSGTLAVSDDAVPADQTSVPFSDLFTWTNTVDFAGTNAMTITVSGADVLLGATLANYQTGNADLYSEFYSFTLGSDIISDPMSDVFVDGVGQSTDRSGGLTGQWYWIIPSGTTFSATVNIQAGQEPLTP